MNALPCPFCGSAAAPRWDAPEPKPFYIRCTDAGCPAHTTGTTYADADVAMTRWNRRAQMPPENPFEIHTLGGFTTRNLIRGELVIFDLDRTGVLTSEAMRFNLHSRALMFRPRE